jgi:glycogen debranching enzyme
MTFTISPDLVKSAQAVLGNNDTGVFVKPGPNQYPHQWNWDSALIALGFSSFDLPRALLEIRSLLIGQWQDGMLPHVVYHGMESDYFPNPSFWEIEKSPNAPKTQTTGITQPPLLATILRMIHDRHLITDFVREVYPHILAWHRWLHTYRDIDNTGLVCIIHPWESGTDDSPRWLKVLETIPTDIELEFSRGDTRYVKENERPYPQDYQRFMYLIDLFRKCNYNQEEILAQSPFVVQDVLFNAILYRANVDLLALGRTIGENTDEISQWIALMESNFNQRFWHEDDGLYYDFDVVAQAPVRINTGIVFLPLYAKLASQKQVERLLKEYFNHPDHYGINTCVIYQLSSASQSLSTWDPRRYWRGPVWILLNWLVYQGLVAYGFEHEAEKLRSDALSLISQSGFREYYDPRDGTGCGSESFSWSAALAIDWMVQDL